MERQTKDRKKGSEVYTNCFLKAYLSNSQENYSIVKLFINNFEDNDQNGIIIGYWKYVLDKWTFVPLTPSHYELISDLFYIKDVQKIPRLDGETRECNTIMETISINY